MSRAAACQSPESSRVLCVGEALALFSPEGSAGRADSGYPAYSAYSASLAGAEANVACTLAALGVPTSFLGNVGDDALGRLVLHELRAAGVDTAHVVVDEHRNTGLYLKEPSAAGSRLRYYRAGSAASAMSARDLPRALLSRVAVVHVSGITAGLSESCRELVERLLARPRDGQVVSFDVNWRPALWDRGAPETLRRLAAQADVVFVGADEAQSLWGIAEPGEIAQLLTTGRDGLPATPRPPGTLVVKDGARGATLVSGQTEVFVPALRAPVVEATGAGDAFAAGFLAGRSAGLADRDSLRLGHLLAARTLQTHRDRPEVPPAAEPAALLLQPELGHSAAPATR
jgi:2-dehydro-3-deoxygluconokinase